MHVRALALDRANHEAAANRRLIFEVEDSRVYEYYDPEVSVLARPVQLEVRPR
jgi:hypothetical protein